MAYENVKAYISVAALNTKAMRAEFEAYMKDKTVPLDERWTAFRLAPIELKDHDSCVPWALAEFLPDDYIMYDGYFHMDRYETRTTLDLIEKVAENNEVDTDFQGKPIPKVDVEALKEIILQNNLGSFEYDW